MVFLLVKGNEEVFSEPELPIESIESTIDESDGVSEESEPPIEQEPLFVIDKRSVSVSASSKRWRPLRLWALITLI